jgi:hypothetical protein
VRPATVDTDQIGNVDVQNRRQLMQRA